MPQRVIGVDNAEGAYVQRNKHGAQYTFTATVDTEGGPERKLEGSLATGNGRKVGDFVASLKTK